MARNVGLITLFVLFVSSAFSQTQEFPWAIRAGGGMLRYYAHPGSSSLSNTSYHPSIELGVSKYLAGGFDFRTQLSIAPNVAFPFTGESSLSGPMIDMNYLLAFKFNNGVFFRESALFGPYFLFGVGGSYVQNNPDAYVPLGGGMQIRVNPKMSLRLESVRKLSVNKKPQSLAHALAFIYNIGSPSDLPPGTLPKEIEEELANTILLSRDSDLDGIVDQEDDCPNHPGFVQHMGCPTSDQVANEAFAMDESGSLTTDEAITLDPAAEEQASIGEDLMSFETLSQMLEEKESVLPSAALVDKPTSLSVLTPEPEPTPAEEEPQIKSKDTPPSPPHLPVSPPAEKTETIIAEAAEPQKPSQTIQASSPQNPCTNTSLPSSDNTPIFFSYGSHELKEDAKDQLKELAEVLQSCEELSIVLEGHTDDVGQEEDNLVLSIMRAFNVKYYLVYEHGISQSRISSAGLGELKPYAENSTVNGREKNRRVDYTFIF